MDSKDALTFNYNLVGNNGRIRLSAILNDKLLHMSDLNIASVQSRDAFAKRLCRGRDGIERMKVDEELLNIAQDVQAAKDRKPDAPQAEQPGSDELLKEMPEDVRRDADVMLTDPLLLRRVIDDIAALSVAGERELTAGIYLIGVSRLLDRPLSAIIQGPSSSGKSYLVDKTTAMFPPEAVIRATQMTPQALYHLPPGSLVHKFVVAGERSRLENDDGAEATRALRQMISEGRLHKLMPMKIEGGRIETVKIEQDGPISYVETTTLTKILDEDSNRSLLLNTDERPKQTRRIVERLASDYCSAARQNDADRIIQRHYAIQRMLKSLPVVIPYAARLGELFNSNRVEMRRAFPQTMSLIQASALLHQRQRQLDSDGCLLALPDDYQVARRLLTKPLARLLGGALSDAARRFYDRLAAWATDVFTATDVFMATDAAGHKVEHGSRRAIYGWLSELQDAGLVEVIEPGRGNKPAKWRLSGKLPDDMEQEQSGLPAVEKVFSREPLHTCAQDVTSCV